MKLAAADVVGHRPALKLSFIFPHFQSACSVFRHWSTGLIYIASGAERSKQTAPCSSWASSRGAGYLAGRNCMPRYSNTPCFVARQRSWPHKRQGYAAALFFWVWSCKQHCKEASINMEEKCAQNGRAMRKEGMVCALPHALRRKGECILQSSP